jgi:hypothetical protein
VRLLESEVVILKQLRHPNIVGYLVRPGPRQTDTEFVPVR